MASISANQIIETVLAVPAFLPATLCTGYIAAWFTNLYQFRQRSFFERLFWSVPLSVSVSTIASVLIGKAFSLNAVVALFAVCATIFIAILILEHLQPRRLDSKWDLGWHPLGGRALLLVFLWMALAILSLIDIKHGDQLFMSFTIYDHAPRVNWTESILRTGVPPDNPMYFYKQPSAMRYYYFWNVVCAAVARMAHLPVRAVYIASCIWGGFILAAIIGLLLKHFLRAGIHLRRQFLIAVSLLVVSGFNSMVIFARVISGRGGLPGAPQIWAVAQLNSWYDSLLFVPHHISSVVCCMFAFLLASLDRSDTVRERLIVVAFISAALASSFGLSIYVAFGFFLTMIAWAIWQISLRRFRAVFLMAAGGAMALVLLLPYLHELRGNSSGQHGGSMFSFAIRETFSPTPLLASGLLYPLSQSHPWAALDLARLILLLPGLAVELGVFLLVLVVYLIPRLRPKPLSPAHQSLLFIAVSALLLSSFLRSNVLDINDFGIRTALFLSLATVLFASEILSAPNPSQPGNPKQRTHALIRIAIVLGVITTLHQAIIFRFTIPIAFSVARSRAANDFIASNLSHNAYISAAGYNQLNAGIQQAAIVQANPAGDNPFWAAVDELNIDRQTAIDTDRPWCRAELGGDPSGCLPMAAAIDSLYSGSSADQARTTCRAYHIDYLISRIYDRAWQNQQSWVWTLTPAVANPEFRALDCR
jgi:hypothetical protein